MKRLLLGTVLFLACIQVLSASPVRFNYQARLSNDSGNPLNGSHTFYFGVWRGGNASIADSGVLVYSESAIFSISSGIANWPVGDGDVTTGTLDSAAIEFSGDVYLQVAVDSPSNVVIPRTRLESVPFAVRALDAPATLFGTFGGSGVDGDHVVSSNEIVPGYRHEYNTLTVSAGKTFDIGDGTGFIAVKGTCTIDGTITATGRGGFGGAAFPSVDGLAGSDATGQSNGSHLILSCASGAGGGGGAAATTHGGDGGGAQVNGGSGGVAAAGFDAGSDPVGRIIAGGVASSSGSGQTLTSNFSQLLTYRGAGGGGGGGASVTNGGFGGAGGGVIYLECNELILNGSITADGANGFQTGTGGGGGGGGGGVVLVRARKITANSHNVTANGGTGGIGGGSPNFDGGKGGNGFWDVVEVH